MTGIKGSHWPPEVTAHLDYLRSREWLASFADEDEAMHYAWTHPGAFVVAERVYLNLVEHSVFRFKKGDASRGQ